MENQEYLSEERYQKNNAKVKKTGKILLIIGIVTLIIGFILSIVGFMGAGNSAINGFDSMENNIINDFNSIEGNPIRVNVNSAQNHASGVFGNIGLFALGGFMLTIGFGLTVVGGVVIFIAHRREITAYTTQQVMPVAQEGIEKMAPTIGKAASEIAKGIKQGINEANKEQDNELNN